MIFDDTRNSLYSEAIAALVNDESVVLDLGAGSGIHGLMAARAGAKKVYLVEPATELDTAKRIAQQYGLADRIVCIQDTIELADIPESVDIIISVFTGNFLLEEDLLPSLFYARETYLKKNGAMIPDRASMEIAPVSSPAYFNEYIACWSEAAQGVDFGLVREFAANSLYYDDHSALAENFLAEPVEIMDIDFMRAVSADCHRKVTMTIRVGGTCHGFLGWFRTQIGDSWLSTSPREKETHWSQAFLPVDPPIQVETGEEIEFELQRPEHGVWTWAVTTQRTSQRYSTFLSEPLSSTTLRKKADHYHARLSDKGELVLEILKRLNGDESTLSVAEEITLKNPKLFPDLGHAKRFVLSLIERYC